MRESLNIAIFSRQGLGDGLNMMILANHLKDAEHKITFFHNIFNDLKSFFPDITFLKNPSNLTAINQYNLIFVEHYNNPLINQIIKKRKSFKKVIAFYPTCNLKKEKFIDKNDFYFNRNISVASNITLFCSNFLNKTIEKNKNNILPPENLVFKKYPKRIIIHPTSNNLGKNWDKKKFISLYHRLKKLGFDPIISLAPHELLEWDNPNLNITTGNSFHDLACLIYESGYLIGNDSGPAHLASNLNIPHMVISCSSRSMKLWRPDFNRGSLLTAPTYLPNPKFFRIKYKYWQKFISIKYVMKCFLSTYN